MLKPLAVFVGLRYTSARRNNHFILFSTLGLGLGVAVLITVLSVMNGFDRELQKRILGMVPHASLHSSTPMTDWRETRQFALTHPRVVAGAPFTSMEVMLANRGQVSGALINGIEPELEQTVSIIGNHMKQGSLELLEPGEFGIILGVDLAYILGVSVGEKVTLVLPEASVSPAGVIPRFKRFTLVGLFEVEAQLDSRLGYIHLEDAARLLRLPEGGVTGIRLKMDDLFAAPQVAWEVATQAGGDISSRNWTYSHGNLFQAIKMEKAMMALLLFFIVAVAAFNIVSSLIVLVSDKSADIAVLRTMGASPGFIMKTFMIQGTVVGTLGVLGGILAGVVLSLTVSDIVAWMENLLGTKLFQAYFVNYLPSQLQTGDVIVVGGIAFVICFLATLYPAWRAARVEPAEALRYE